MRVISGKARGLKLKSLKGLNTRPTTDRIKESLFNIINQIIEDAQVLDLFAGTGALAIESLSRGAKYAYINDLDRESIKIIKDNLRNSRLEEKAEVINKDFIRVLNQLSEKNIKLDIVFLDPPYGKKMEIEAMKLISERKLLSENGIVIIENETIDNLDETLYDMIRYDKRNYGRTSLNFYKRG